MNHPASEASVQLPACVKAVLWEYDAEALCWTEDRALITGRVLADGSWSAVTWLRETAGDEALRCWITEREGRGLSPRQLRFWQLVLDLPKDAVDGWTERQRQSVWEQRTSTGRLPNAPRSDG